MLSGLFGFNRAKSFANFLNSFFSGSDASESTQLNFLNRFWVIFKWQDRRPGRGRFWQPGQNPLHRLSKQSVLQTGQNKSYFYPGIAFLLWNRSLFFSKVPPLFIRIIYGLLALINYKENNKSCRLSIFIK